MDLSMKILKIPAPLVPSAGSRENARTAISAWRQLRPCGTTRGAFRQSPAVRRSMATEELVWKYGMSCFNGISMGF